MDSISCPAFDKWDGMSVLGRANIFKDNGISDCEALETAEEDNFWNLEELYQLYFEE